MTVSVVYSVMLVVIPWLVSIAVQEIYGATSVMGMGIQTLYISYSYCKRGICLLNGTCNEIMTGLHNCAGLLWPQRRRLCLHLVLVKILI